MKKFLIYLTFCCCCFNTAIIKANDNENITKSVSDLLNADGTINTNTGYSGNLSLKGYKVVMSEEGAPIFIKVESNNPQNSSSSRGNDLWSNEFGAAGVGGSVYTALIHPNGDMYLAGYFENFGNKKANSIIKWDGTTWSTLGDPQNPGIRTALTSGLVEPGDIYTMAYYNNMIYVGGLFTHAGSMPAISLVAWNGTNWVQVPETGGSVKALLPHNNTLYIGGVFRSYKSIAKLEGNVLDTVGIGFNGTSGFGDESVETLCMINNVLYAGGRFLRSGSTVVNNIARFNGTSWQAIGGEQYNLVREFEIYQGKLLVGGNFNGSIGGVSTNVLALYNPETGLWSKLPGENFKGSIGELYVKGDTIYIGGGFNQTGNNTQIYAAKFDGTSWSMIGDGLNAAVSHFIEKDNKLMVLGVFNKFGSKLLNYAATYSQAAGWEPLININSFTGKGLNDYPAANAGANAFCVAGNDLYMGGRFSAAGNKIVNHIARWDGTEWHSIGSGNENGVSAVPQSEFDLAQAYVTSIAVSGDKVYVGGCFDKAGSMPAKSIAVWDGTSWSALGDGLGTSDINSRPLVQCIQVVGNDVYVGGTFSKAGSNNNVGNIARWDGTQWNRVGYGFSDYVGCLNYHNGILYAGGNFERELISNKILNRIAQWNGSQWTWLGTSTNRGVTGGASGSFVNTIEVISPDSILIGGLFYIAGASTSTAGDPFEVDSPYLTLYKPSSTSWHLFGDITFEGNVTRIVQTGKRIYISGQFFTAGSSESVYITYYDKATRQFYPLGSGVNKPIVAMTKQIIGDSTYIYAGGIFTSAGNKPANFIGRYTESFLTDISPVSTITPSDFNLYQNFPNPFNPSTNIKFDIKETGVVKLIIYSITGEKVAELLNGKLNPGSYNVTFDARNLSSGIYYYSLITNENVHTKKMMLVK